MDTFSVTNGTRGSIPRVPFAIIKEKIIGKKYTLSLVFVGDTRMRTLNRIYRGKNKTTDILSFPLDHTSGEIFISPKEAVERSAHFGMTPQNYIAFLFIHGILHLKGHEHGRTMERLEDSWCKRLGISKPTR